DFSRSPILYSGGRRSAVGGQAPKEPNAVVCGRRSVIYPLIEICLWDLTIVILVMVMVADIASNTIFTGKRPARGV
ncbi:MAG: hypothetical protein QME63_10190, partial [Actinomycetota bacterium]|nr:hypothetical protein [Actinomycetota bacterium]